MKRVLTTVTMATLAALLLTGCGGVTPAATEPTSSAPPVAETTPAVTTPSPTPTTAPEPDVSAEWTAALKSAENYLEFMPFSKQGLFDQLTSEYGDQFPADAAQYAVDNVEVDWNAEALEAAISYRDTMSMASAAIRDQLISEFVDQFTPEEADYAVANLPG